MTLALRITFFFFFELHEGVEIRIKIVIQLLQEKCSWIIYEFFKEDYLTNFISSKENKIKYIMQSRSGPKTSVNY